MVLLVQVVCDNVHVPNDHIEVLATPNGGNNDEGVAPNDNGAPEDAPNGDGKSNVRHVLWFHKFS